MGIDPPAGGAMKLTPTSFLILGMVRLGVRTGYDIKKFADISTQNFWPISLAQVYPELSKLHDGGFLTRRSDPKGGRPRSVYTITERGETALGSWLRSTKTEPVQLRDEAMLRLFFADALSAADQLALVARLRERNRGNHEEMRREILPRAEAVEPGGPHYPAVAARFSADLFAFAEKWLMQLSSELEADKKS